MPVMNTILILDAAGDLGARAAVDGIPRVGQWFLDAFGGDASAFEVADVVQGTPPESLDYAGVIVTGSPASAYDRHFWLDPLRAYVRRVVEAGVPTLGVCFGHQLLGHVLGGRVAGSPNSWEVGLQEVTLTDAGRADPLFAGLPDPLPVLESHRDAVLEMPPGAVLLAQNDHTRIQAFAIGDHVRAVQFHPEFTPERLAWLIAARTEKLAEEAGIDASQVIAGMRPTPEARRVLDNFREHFRR